MSELSTKRHSLSHIMSQAIAATFPDLTILRGVGPAIDNGFYQDYDFGDFQLTEAHLKDIEKKMKHILKQNQLFVQSFLTLEEARAKFAGDKYKLELIADLAAEGETQFGVYTNTLQNGTVTYDDLCAGPHVEKTAELDENAFQLDRIAGAYWRGSEKNKMLTRIYGLAFETKEELDAYIHAREEAKKRDHRTLGSAMELFTIVDEVGAGLPLYLPRGAKLRQILERYMTQEAEKANYQYVYTPHIGKSDLFRKSWHLDHYADGMYAPINMVNLRGEGAVDGKAEQFYLKPMNCPMHHYIYMHKPRSYKDLPLKLMEYGTVYRYEESGVLSGLIRVRGFTQNDAHVYCMRSQLYEVISEALARFIRAYEDLGVVDYKIRFSLPDFENNREKYWEETQEWKDSIVAMREVLDKLGVDYYDAPNEAAFYGPKIDIQVKNVNGKEDTLSTIQVDFSIAPKFGITYIDTDGTEKIPAIIHMALMGSIERFMAFIIEMNAGRFPFWVAPEQIRILTVIDAVLPYVQEIESILKETYLMKPLRFNTVRYGIDDKAETLGKKIRKAETDKVPLIIVVGEKDMNERTVSLRMHNEEKTISLDELKSFIEGL
jgi:threonyl-tRNA synthetase